MIDLIKAATLSENNQHRQQAEASIIKIRTENPEDFFLQAGNIFQNYQLPSNIRQASAALLTLSITTEHNQSCLWDALPTNSKLKFKEIVLSTLIDSDHMIRRGAANIVAAICCIEIPRKQWSGIVQKISANINNEDLIIKQVSILTLGQICERLKNKNDFTFDAQLQQTILTGICLGLKQSTHPVILKTALKALNDSIGSMPDIFKNAQYRDYLIKQIADIITNRQNIDICLQTLSELAKYNYIFMKNYINGFYTLLDPIMSNYKDKDNCMLAIEFWETLANQYKDQQYSRAEDSSDPSLLPINYITGEMGVKIVQKLLQNLCVIEQSEEDQNEENTINDSASKCLESIFISSAEEYQGLVLNFVQNTIKHENFQYRQASIRSFSLLLLGLEERRGQQLVNVSLLELLNLLKDSNKIVQLSAIKSMSIISEECSNIILHHSGFLQILQTVIEKLSLGQKYLRNVCKIIENFCQCVEYSQGEISSMDNLCEQLIKLFIQNLLMKERTHQEINFCSLALFSLIRINKNAAVAKKNIQFVVQNITKIPSGDQEKKNLYYSVFFTILQSCLISLRKQNLSVEALSTIYQLVIEHYKNLKDVDSDGFYVISALAFFFKGNRSMVDDFWKYIEFSFQKMNEEGLFKASISCICDFAHNYGDFIKDKIEIVFKEFFNAFEKNSVSRECRLDILMCFGELFLYCKETSRLHIRKVMDLILLCCQASIKMTKVEPAYAEALQDTVIETITCLFHGLNDENRPPCQELTQYIGDIFKYVQITSQKINKPKLDYVKTCVLLLADISGFYRNQCKPFVTQPFIKECIATLKKYNNNGDLSQTIGYAESRF